MRGRAGKGSGGREVKCIEGLPEAYMTGGPEVKYFPPLRETGLIHAGEVSHGLEMRMLHLVGGRTGRRLGRAYLGSFHVSHGEGADLVITSGLRLVVHLPGNMEVDSLKGRVSNLNPFTGELRGWESSPSHSSRDLEVKGAGPAIEGISVSAVPTPMRSCFVTLGFNETFLLGLLSETSASAHPGSMIDEEIAQGKLTVVLHPGAGSDTLRTSPACLYMTGVTFDSFSRDRFLPFTTPSICTLAIALLRASLGEMVPSTPSICTLGTRSRLEKEYLPFTHPLRR